MGAGHAGAQAAISLREGGFAGAIQVLSDESEPPYERPPLSKLYLMHGQGADTFRIRPPSFWAEQRVELSLGCRVEAVDPGRRQVIASDRRVSYDTLIWAAGGRARRLSCEGRDLQGVYVLRNLADAGALRAELSAGRRVVIVGGGYIGLEAAAVFAQAALDVTVLEAQSRVLARVASEEFAAFILAQHESRGVRVRLNAQVVELTGSEGRVSNVCLAEGPSIPADIVLVGIGILPNVEPLLAAGAEPGPPGVGGLRVDGMCRTSLADVYAIGDCAAHTGASRGEAHLRVESVQNATGTAQSAVRGILGDPTPYRATPWFWSDQYDLQIQSAGWSLGHDRLVVRGAPAERRFAFLYVKAGRLIGLDCVNLPRDFAQGRALIGAPAPDERALADAATPLKKAIAVLTPQA